MKRILAATLILLAANFGDMGSANVLPQMPIEEQFSQADLVIIGRIGPRQPCQVAAVSRICAQLRSDLVLKGTPTPRGAQRLLVLEAEFVEFGIEDMRLDGCVMIFMRRYRDEIYFPIVGRNSVFAISRAQ